MRAYNYKCIGLKIRIRSQMYGHLHVLHFILYLTFTASLYDEKYACFHMGVVTSLSRLIHGIARQMGAPTKRAFWVVEIYRCSLSFVSPSL